MTMSVNQAKAELADLKAVRADLYDTARTDCCRRHDVTPAQRRAAQAELVAVDADIAELSKVIGTSYTKPVLGLTALVGGGAYVTGLAGAGVSYVTGLIGTALSNAATVPGVSHFVAMVPNATMAQEAVHDLYNSCPSPTDYLPEVSSKLVIGMTATVALVALAVSKLFCGKQKAE